MYTQPGKKLLFMGGELAQWREWNHDASWTGTCSSTRTMPASRHWLRDLNHFYRTEPAATSSTSTHAGFEWLDADDAWNSVLSYVRKSRPAHEGGRARGTARRLQLHAAHPRELPRRRAGACRFWREVLNSDAEAYGGSGVGNLGGVMSAPMPFHGRPHSINLRLPPLGMLVLKHEPGA
jgi:1,4-alpha-glucan branching enzyme